MAILTVGIDLAKNVFALHGVNGARTACINCIRDLLSEVAHLDERIKQYDAHIRTLAREWTAAQQLMGVGETTATAIVAMVGSSSSCRSEERSDDHQIGRVHFPLIPATGPP